MVQHVARMAPTLPQMPSVASTTRHLLPVSQQATPSQVALASHSQAQAGLVRLHSGVVNLPSCAGQLQTLIPTQNATTPVRQAGLHTQRPLDLPAQVYAFCGARIRGCVFVCYALRSSSNGYFVFTRSLLTRSTDKFCSLPQ